MEKVKYHWDQLKEIMDFVTFSQEMGLCKDDEVDEVRSKLNDINIVLENISKRNR